MKVTLHQPHLQVAHFKEIQDYLKKQVTVDESVDHLHLFPESFLSGYLLKDLLWDLDFIEAYEEHLKALRQWWKNSGGGQSKAGLLLGGPHYSSWNGQKIIGNALYLLDADHDLVPVYFKQHLATYDIFDEKKYYTAYRDLVELGTVDPKPFQNNHGLIDWRGMRVGLLICEDLWPSVLNSQKPLAHLWHQLAGQAPDLLFCANASPFSVYKHQKRLERVQKLALTFKAPTLYLNTVSGEEEILFDGKSFGVDKAGADFVTLPSFQGQNFEIKIQQNRELLEGSFPLRDENTSEKLYPTALNKEGGVRADFCEQVLKALCFGFREFTRKNPCQHFLLGLSGGIDSALCAAIAVKAMREDQKLTCIHLPSQYSSSLSRQLAEELTQNLGLKLVHQPIKFLHQVLQKDLENCGKWKVDGLTDENLQARLRGLLLNAWANHTRGMIINPSNKSELMVGYSTLYGDSVGAFSLIGDLYKTQVFELAQYLHDREGTIPQALIDREPSAELRDNQKDQDSLPPYDQLDHILEATFSGHHSSRELKNLYPEKLVNRVRSLYFGSEFKRFQFAPIFKVQSKSLGFGHRLPLTCSTDW